MAAAALGPARCTRAQSARPLQETLREDASLQLAVMQKDALRYRKAHEKRQELMNGPQWQLEVQAEIEKCKAMREAEAARREVVEAAWDESHRLERKKYSLPAVSETAPVLLDPPQVIEIDDCFVALEFPEVVYEQFVFEDCEDGHGPTERSSEVAGPSDEGLGSSAASRSDQGMELDTAHSDSDSRAGSPSWQQLPQVSTYEAVKITGRSRKVATAVYLTEYELKIRLLCAAVVTQVYKEVLFTPEGHALARLLKAPQLIGQTLKWLSSVNGHAARIARSLLDADMVPKLDELVSQLVSHKGNRLLDAVDDILKAFDDGLNKRAVYGFHHLVIGAVYLALPMPDHAAQFKELVAAYRKRAKAQSPMAKMHDLLPKRVVVKKAANKVHQESGTAEGRVADQDESKVGPDLSNGPGTLRFVDVVHHKDAESNTNRMFCVAQNSTTHQRLELTLEEAVEADFVAFAKFVDNSLLKLSD